VNVSNELIHIFSCDVWILIHCTL